VIILLDHNYTLVANSDQKRSPFIRQIEIEEYRHDLVNLVCDQYVILVTARPKKYSSVTIERIKQKTGWSPDEWYFNKGYPPPAWKKFVLEKFIFPRHGNDPALYLAIESNPRTRSMYQSFDITAISQSERGKIKEALDYDN
jgi:hypothetical protein